MANTDGELVRLAASDGHAFDAFVAAPEGVNLGGLVILQEIFGVTDQLKSLARRYAEYGFRTVVPALFDRKAPGTVVPFDQAKQGLDLAVSLDPEQVLLDVDAALAASRDETHAPASVMGFCFGGGLALRAAIGLDAASAISFYGTRLEAILGPAVGCPMQFHFGATDSHTPPEIIEAVRTKVAGADIHIYAAGHAFANDARAELYVKDAAGFAHDRSLAFLKANHAG